MSNKKAALITAIMTVMTLVILACLLALKLKTLFFIAAGFFAVLGLIASATSVYGWIADSQPRETIVPVIVPAAKDEAAPDVIAKTYDEVVGEAKK